MKKTASPFHRGAILVACGIGSPQLPQFRIEPTKPGLPFIPLKPLLSDNLEFSIHLNRAAKAAGGSALCGIAYPFGTLL